MAMVAANPRAAQVRRASASNACAACRLIVAVSIIFCVICMLLFQSGAGVGNYDFADLVSCLDQSMCVSQTRCTDAVDALGQGVLDVSPINQFGHAAQQGMLATDGAGGEHG